MFGWADELGLAADELELCIFSKEKLAGMGGAVSRWVDDFSPGALKAIGAVEFLAAVGLIVPAALGIARWCRWLLPVRCCCLLAR